LIEKAKKGTLVN